MVDPKENRGMIILDAAIFISQPVSVPPDVLRLLEDITQGHLFAAWTDGLSSSKHFKLATPNKLVFIAS